MILKIATDYESMSLLAAEEIINTVKNKPNALLCIAAGDTPKRMCRLVYQIAEKENVNFSRCNFVSLDEWVGISPDNEGSCMYFLNTMLFGPLKIDQEHAHVFNSLSKDLARECEDMDNFIKAKGGIDLMVVGVGRNGHIGFNEPGLPFDNYSHVVDLDSTTTSVGQKYFKEATVLTKGITLGLKHLLESRKAILIANGNKKAEVIRQAVEGEVNPQMPASIMREHPKGLVIIDEEASSLLNKK
jgi:glucosamine-6-phosphate isomerase